MDSTAGSSYLTDIVDGARSTIFSSTIESFKSSVASDVSEAIQKVCTLDDLNEAIRDIERDQANRKCLHNLGRIRPLLEALLSYSSVIEVFVNAKPDVLAFIWGPIKLCLQVTSNTLSAFDALLDAYSSLRDALPVIISIDQLFHSKNMVRGVLMDVYKDILTFHLRTLAFFKKRGKSFLQRWQILFKLTFRTFEGLFGDVLKNLERSKQLLLTLADISHFQEAQQHFHVTQKHRLEAQEEFNMNRQRAEKDKLFTVLDWLSPISQSNKHYEIQQHRRKFPLTTQWLFNDHRWLDFINCGASKPEIFWLSGIPGAGKTFLFNAAIDEIAQTRTEGLEIGLAYFYCKYNDPLQSNYEEICKSLIAQLLKSNQNGLEYLYNFALQSGERYATSKSGFQEILQSMVQCFDRVFIGIDGIDECELAERKHITSLLRTLTQPSEQGQVVKCFVFGCAERDIERSLAHCNRLDLKSKHMTGSIEHYVNARLALINLLLRLRPQKIQEISRKIVAQSAGMFLLARLIIDTLENSGSREEVQEELERSDLPLGLNQAYGRILARLQSIPNPANQRRAKLVLEMVVSARRPLKIHELQGILSIRLEDQSIDIESRRYLHHFKELCGPIIEVTEDGSVELVHATAKKYLDENHSAFLETYLARYRLTDICMSYLSFPCFDPSLDEATVVQCIQSGDYALQDYAVSNWIPHAQVLTGEQPRPNVTLDHFHRLWRLVLWPRYSGSFQFGENDDLPINGFPTTFETLDNSFHSYNADDPSSTERVPQLFIHILYVRSLIENHLDAGTCDEQQEFLIEAYGSTPFKCPVFGCPEFQSGYSSREKRDAHVGKVHVRPFKCSHESCDFRSIGFASQRALENHLSCFHDMRQTAELPLRLSNLKPQSIWKSIEDAIDCDNAALLQSLTAEVSEVPKDSKFILRAVKRGSSLCARFLINRPAFFHELKGTEGRANVDNALCFIAKAGDTEMMSEILTLVTRDQAILPNWDKVITYAALSNHAEVIKLILDRFGSQDSSKIPRPDGKSIVLGREVLAAAVKQDFDEVREILLENGKKLGLNQRSIELAANAAAQKQRHELVRKLFEVGSHLAVSESSWNNYSSAIQKREVKGHDEMVKYTIEKNSGTVRENSNGKTWGNALQVAASNGDDQKIEKLLLEGADINCSTGDRGTALQAASRQGHVRTVRFLLERGADPTIYSKANRGYTRANFFRQNHNALIEAVRADHATVVLVLLEDESRWSVRSTFPAMLKDAPPWTPLHFAAQSCSLEAALCLVERGADVCAMDENFTTPLHLAATIRRDIVQKSRSRGRNEESRKVEMIKFLLNHGADATAKDSDGNTPLHCIWRSPRQGSISYMGEVRFKLEETLRIAKLLLEKGADLHAQNNKGQTPRDFCITNLPNARNTGYSLLRSAIDVIDPQ